MAHKVRIRFETTIEFEVEGKLRKEFSEEGIMKEIREELEKEEGIEVLTLNVKEIDIKREGEEKWTIEKINI